MNNILKKYFLIGAGVFSFGSVGFYFIYQHLKRRLGKKSISNRDRPQNNNSYTSNYPTSEYSNNSADTSSLIAPNIDERTLLKCLTQLSENVLHSIVMSYDILREDYDREAKSFRNIRYKDFTVELFKAGSN
jgi:hypothetical protein